MKTLIKTAFAALVISVSCAGVTLADTGSDLLKRVDEIRAPGANFSFDVNVKPSNAAAETMSVSVKDKSKGLVKFVQPVKMAGRAILFVDANMWVYVPGTRRAVRISPQQRLLGGVSSADVARIVYSEDYQVAASSTSGANTVLQLAPRTKAAAYGRIDLTVDGRGAPQIALFYDVSGTRQLKTVTFGGYANILGASRPTTIRVVDHMDGDAVTVMKYSNFKLTATPDAWYQPAYLPKM